jgi:hypothetical protein
MNPKDLVLHGVEVMAMKSDLVTGVELLLAKGQPLILQVRFGHP